MGKHVDNIKFILVFLLRPVTQSINWGCETRQ